MQSHQMMLMVARHGNSHVISLTYTLSGPPFVVVELAFMFQSTCNSTVMDLVIERAKFEILAVP